MILRCFVKIMKLFEIIREVLNLIGIQIPLDHIARLDSAAEGRGDRLSCYTIN